MNWHLKKGDLVLIGKNEDHVMFAFSDGYNAWRRTTQKEKEDWINKFCSGKISISQNKIDVPSDVFKKIEGMFIVLRPRISAPRGKSKIVNCAEVMNPLNGDKWFVLLEDIITE